MKKLTFLAAATLLLSQAVLADGWEYGHHHHHRHHHHRDVGVMVGGPVYMAPQVVYREAPPVVYRETVVYQDRPVYAPPTTYYRAPAQGYYQESPTYYQRPNGDRVAGQMIGAVAGGVIGNRFGAGSGRVAATAVGAVLGSVVGGRLAE